MRTFRGRRAESQPVGIHYAVTGQPWATFPCYLKLRPDAVPADDLAYWKHIASLLPPIPKRTENGVTVPDNAGIYSRYRTNSEAPDIYCVFPFRVYGLLRDEHPIDEAREAWKRMPSPGHVCWYQTGAVAARLGLAEGARKDVVIRARSAMRRSDKRGEVFRFPGYFGSPHDSCPDFDGPGNMMNTLQEMIVQPGPAGEILLLPAWPAEWDAEFRLYATGGVLVSGKVKNGKLVEWNTVPESARSRVRVMRGE